MTNVSFRLAAGCLVVALVIVAWAPALRNGFLNYDDPQMIVANPRFHDPGTGDFVAAFTETREFAYLPLYVVALMADASIFGIDSAAFHLGSIAWHAAAAVLVLLFVHALTRSRTVALVAAVVFAAHPMAAESVAWASGRKDQVSFVLLMVALAAALGHLRHGGWGRIILGALCAAAAMLAKGSAVVYPLLAALLVPMVTADGTRSPRARPLALLFAAALVAAAGAALHLWVALAQGTAGTPDPGSTWERGVAFLEAVCRYASHLVLPMRLSIHYEGVGGRSFLAVIGGLVVLWTAAVTVRIARRPERGRVLRVLAAPWFLAVLLPFNGVFPRTSVAMADRYAFDALPAAGLVAGLLVAALGRRTRAGAVVAVAGLAAALVVLAHGRAAEFKDGETVFRAALRVNPDDGLAMLKLGEALRDKPPASANRPEAVRLMTAAIGKAADPVREARARLVLADTLLQDSQFQQCVAESDRLLEIERGHGSELRALGFDALTVRYNRAAALLGAGRRDEALAALDEVLRLDASHRPSRLLRAALEAQSGLIALSKAPEGTERDRERERVNRSICAYENVLAEIVEERKAGQAAEDEEVRASCDLVGLLRHADWRPDYLNAARMRAEDVVRRHPGRAEGFLARAQVVAEADPEAALENLRAAAALEPCSTAVLRSIANGFLALAKNQDAIAVLEAARARDPGDPGPVADLRGIYVAAARSHLEDPRKGPDVSRTRQALALAKKLGPDTAEMLEIEAACFETENRRDEAGAVWEKLLVLDPANGKAKVGVALARQRRRAQGDAAEVEGHAAMARGDEAAALDAFERTCGFDPDNLAANDALARLRMKRGDKAAALAHARRFLALAAKRAAESDMLKDEVALMEKIVRSLEEPGAESRK